jgi:urea transport system substrate-binding protein
MAGQTFNAPSGFTLTMDATNHHLHKPVMIGEIESNGQFNVVWQTDKPVRAQPWSPWIAGNDKKPDHPIKPPPIKRLSPGCARLPGRHKSPR